MSKEIILKDLDKVKTYLNQLDKDLTQSEIEFITRKSTQQTVQSITARWFEEIESVIHQFGVPEETKKKYTELFTQLLELSLKTSRKKTYLKIIQQILSDFREDIILVVMKSTSQITTIAHFAKILESVTEEEKEYLNEALGCAKHKFFRGSMVLVWSAAINRMQKVVEKLGLKEFNKKSKEMKNISDGRFKRFSKSFNVHSLSELGATVFDRDLLWVLEYWNLIDSNQHERLSICLTMRNNAAHPGEAPISEVNLASAFSDIKNIVFDNPQFKLN